MKKILNNSIIWKVKTEMEIRCHSIVDYNTR